MALIMMRSTKLEHTMGVAMTRLLLYHFVGFAHNAVANVDGRSGMAAGAQWLPWQLLAVSVRTQWKQ